MVKFSIKYPTEIVLPKYVIQNIPLNCDLFWFLPSSCGVVRLSILPSQGSDLGFKSRREHFIFGVETRLEIFTAFWHASFLQKYLSISDHDLEILGNHSQE